MSVGAGLRAGADERGGTSGQERGFAGIERNIKIQSRMITELLDMSRLEIGKLPRPRELLDRVPADTGCRPRHAAPA